MKMSPEYRAELDRIHLYLSHNESSLPAINQVAMLLLRKGFPLEEALKAYSGFLAKQPASSDAAFNYAWYLTRDGQFEPAIRMYRRAIEQGVGQPEEACLNMANIFMDHLGDEEMARQALERALELNPRYPAAYHNLGNLAEQMGDRKQSAAFFEKCLEIDPHNESALARLADTHRFDSAEDPMLPRLIRAAQTSNNCDLHYALASAFNQLADYEKAWAHFSRANDLDRQDLPPYRPEQTEALFDKIMSRGSREWVDRFPGESHTPVFICGMFRSGSTLLERVLAAHPEFTAGGESEFFPRLVLREFHDFPDGLENITAEELLEWRNAHESLSTRLTGGSGRLTDKRPDNFLYIGLIKAVLPSARFIVTERDWRDVALSIFSTRLGAMQNYATRLSDLRHYIAQQERLVDHWASVLGDDLLRIRYEKLAREPRSSVGRLLDALGEDWDDRCLEFDKLESSVKTASVWQVREPLHTRSIGRWKNYQPYFEKEFGESLDDSSPQDFGT